MTAKPSVGQRLLVGIARAARDVMLAALEQYFGTTQTGAPIEWLSDNSSAYIDHRTRRFARELRLEPLTTPVRSPQSNGMVEAIVKSIKHDYIAFMNKLNVQLHSRIWLVPSKPTMNAIPIKR